MKIALNLQRANHCKNKIQIKNNNQFISNTNIRNLNSDVVSFRGFEDEQKQLLDDIKKGYWETLANASSDEEKVSFLHSSSGLLPRSPWDSSKQTMYIQPVIHKFSFGEIVQILNEMKSNEARIDILTFPEYVVKSEEDLFNGLGIDYSTGSYEISTKTRLLRYSRYNPFRESDDKQKEDVETFNSILVQIMNDDKISAEKREIFLKFYEPVCPPSFTPEAQKYRKLFSDEKGRVDWHILSKSLDSKIIDLLGQLKVDKEVSDKEKIKILSADSSYSIIKERIYAANNASGMEEKKKHFDVIDAIMDATPEGMKHFIFSISNPFVATDKAVLGNIKTFGMVIDSCAKFNPIEKLLEYNEYSTDTMNHLLSGKYDMFKTRGVFESVYNSTSLLDSKLALMAAHHSYLFPRENAFNFHPEFCLGKLNDLESEARNNDDVQSIIKIQKTRENLYQRLTYYEDVTTFEDVKSLLENAPSDEERILVIKAMLSPENDTKSKQFMACFLLYSNLLASKSKAAEEQPFNPPFIHLLETGLHKSFAEIENMKFVIDSLLQIEKNGNAKDSNFNKLLNALLEEYKKVCSAVYGENSDTTKENIQSLADYINK